MSAVIAALIGAVVGAASGGYLAGGPLPLIWGAILGTAAGYALQVVFALTARRHVRGPVDDHQPELTAAVTALHDVVMRRHHSTAALLDQTSRVARGLMWVLCDPTLSDQQHRRLRYHAFTLAAAATDYDKAQSELTDATSVPGVGEWAIGQGPDSELIERAATLVEELRCQSSAARSVADDIGLAGI